MKTFNIATSPTKYKEILDSIIEQGHALKSLHNPQTWRLSALTFALHLHDCTVLFEDVRNRWSKQLPFSEAWDVDFAIWKNKVWSAVIDTNSFTSIDKYNEWKHLCDSDINLFIEKASDCLNGNVPISVVLDFLQDKETGLSAVILNMGQALTEVLVEIDKIPMSTTPKQYVQYYDNLMSIYMNERVGNLYPITVGDEVISFDKWIASKTEKQRSIRIPNKLHSIHANMLSDKIWKELWEDNVVFDQHLIDKEGIGRSIFSQRKSIIGNENVSCSESMFNLFSSLALCNHLWEYEYQRNSDAFDNLAEAKRDILRRIESLIEKGEWIEPASEDSMKGFIRQVMGVGSRKLFGEEEKMSKILWEIFESGKGDRVRIVFQLLIGYFAFYNLLPENKKSDLLNKTFFGREATTYQNIDHGKPGSNNMPNKFKVILPLLDHYRPQQ